MKNEEPLKEQTPSFSMPVNSGMTNQDFDKKVVELIKLNRHRFINVFLAVIATELRHTGSPSLTVSMKEKMPDGTVILIESKNTVTEIKEGEKGK